MYSIATLYRSIYHVANYVCIYVLSYLPEPHCVGEYLIDVSPSQSDRNDNECKSREIISAIVDKVSM